MDRGTALVLGIAAGVAGLGLLVISVVLFQENNRLKNQVVSLFRAANNTMNFKPVHEKRILGFSRDLTTSGGQI